MAEDHEEGLCLDKSQPFVKSRENEKSWKYYAYPVVSAIIMYQVASTMKSLFDHHAVTSGIQKEAKKRPS